MSHLFRILDETSDGLGKIVGYPEVIKSLGVSRSTILRAINSGELPPPRKIKARSVWLASEINAWARALFEDRLTNLDAAAATNPGDLEPDQLEAQALDLVVKSIERRTGQPLDPANLALQVHVQRRVTEDEFQDAERRAFAIYCQRFAHFDRMRACVMAAWLFECLRPVIEQSVPVPQRQMYRDATALALFGGAALHDDAWAEVETQYQQAFDPEPFK